MGGGTRQCVRVCHQLGAMDEHRGSVIVEAAGAGSGWLQVGDGIGTLHRIEERLLLRNKIL